MTDEKLKKLEVIQHAIEHHEHFTQHFLRDGGNWLISELKEAWEYMEMQDRTYELKMNEVESFERENAKLREKCERMREAMHEAARCDIMQNFGCIGCMKALKETAE